mmetsp:Transcript_19368/g.73219  ORF Transcript_19368/g.73219 Transcript_19368/m.73219 type:complete len:222 (-) Transcript_19368:1745-2410(-)
MAQGGRTRWCSWATTRSRSRPSRRSRARSCTSRARCSQPEPRAPALRRTAVASRPPASSCPRSRRARPPRAARESQRAFATARGRLEARVALRETRAPPRKVVAVTATRTTAAPVPSSSANVPSARSATTAPPSWSATFPTSTRSRCCLGRSMKPSAAPTISSICRLTSRIAATWATRSSTSATPPRFYASSTSLMDGAGAASTPRRSAPSATRGFRASRR